MPWQLAHPLWQCGFRPFFAVTLLFAIGLMGLWLLVLGAGWPLPAVPGGVLVWHVHELLLGVSLAAVAGFALTAVPEFTDTPGFEARQVRQLLVWWLAGRVTFWLSGWWTPGMLVLAGIAHTGFVFMLTLMVGPRLWRDRGRRQQGFWWSLLALLVTVAGFYGDAVQGNDPMRWLLATLGVLMSLIVVAMSRISMAIVNASIDEVNARRSISDLERIRSAEVAAAGTEVTRLAPVLPDEPSAYLARPPRRHLAVICIMLFTVMQWFDPEGRITAWLALATSASMLNLLNDWHIGRPLFLRWPLMLYGVYLFMASGYGLIGLMLLSGQGSSSPGIHLLTAGALGLAIYAVICIAGYTHSGLSKEGRSWVPAGALLLAASGVLRALAYWFEPATLLQLAGLAWCLAFAWQGWQMLPVFMRSRADGAWGCDAPRD